MNFTKKSLLINLTIILVCYGAICEVVLADDSSMIEWSIEEGGNGHFYALTSQNSSWIEAEEEAVSQGGHLVTIDNEAENDFIRETFLTGDESENDYWIGLYVPFGDWTNTSNWEWVSGSQSTFRNWRAGQPDSGYNDGEDDRYAAINYLNTGSDEWDSYPNLAFRTIRGIIEVESSTPDSDQYTEGYEAGRQYCIDYPEECGLRPGKEAFAGELAEHVQSYLTLTEDSVPFNLSPGSYVQAYGSNGMNTLNLEEYARLQCRNFIGENEINIEETSTEFTVYRSGATVYLNSSSGTRIEIPATETSQTLRFADGSLELVISGGNVMLGNQVVDETEQSIDSSVA